MRHAYDSHELARERALWQSIMDDSPTPPAPRPLPDRDAEIAAMIRELGLDRAPKA